MPWRTPGLVNCSKNYQWYDKNGVLCAELLDCFKREKEEEQKRKKNEEDIAMVMGSTDAGEEPSESNNLSEDVSAMATTTASGAGTTATDTAVVATTAPTEPSVATVAITHSPMG